MNLMNQYDQVVTENFAKGFVDHRSIGLRAKAVTNFAFDHSEGRLNISPIVIVLKEFFVLPQEVSEHVAPYFAVLSCRSKVCAVRLESNERESSGISNGGNVLHAQIGLIARYLRHREVFV